MEGVRCKNDNNKKLITVIGWETDIRLESIVFRIVQMITCTLNSVYAHPGFEVVREWRKNNWNWKWLTLVSNPYILGLFKLILKSPKTKCKNLIRLVTNPHFWSLNEKRLYRLLVLHSLSPVGRDWKGNGEWNNKSYSFYCRKHCFNGRWDKYWYSQYISVYF